MAMQHEAALGDVRRSSLTPQLTWRFPTLTRNAERLLAYEADQWQCMESRKLNDRIVELCRAWRHTESPLVTSCPSPWPLIKSIRIAHDDDTLIGGYDQLDFSADDTVEHTQRLLTRLRDLVRARGLPSVVCKCDQQRRNSISSLQEDVRKSKEFLVTNSNCIQLDDTELRTTVSDMILKNWGLSGCSLHLYKIGLYEPGDHFAFHRDALHSPRHLGTLEVTLETTDMQGGSLVFRDYEYDPTSDYDSALDGKAGNSSIVMKTSDFRTQDMLKMYAFYTDTEHAIQSIKQGTRVSLEYQIIIGDEKADTANIMWNPEAKNNYTGLMRNVVHKIEKKVEQAVDAVGDMFIGHNEADIDRHILDIVKFTLDNVPAGRTPALLLSHLYPVMGGTDVRNLRGYDRMMYDALQRSGLVGQLELMPVCLVTTDRKESSAATCMLPRVTRCVSLQKEASARRENHKLTLFVTPVTAINCMDALGEAFLDNTDQMPTQQFTYITMAMILNNIVVDEVNEEAEEEDDMAAKLAMVFF